MKTKITLGTLSLVASAILVGCGSSSSNTTSSDSSSDNTILKTGAFIDGAVTNAEYTTTSGLTGKTNANGKFSYKEGDSVKLHLGNLNLGEVKPQTDGLVTPSMLTSGDKNQTILMLRVLQALDNDGNTSNGIQIDDAVLANLEEIENTDINDHNETTLLELDATLATNLDRDGDKEIDVDNNEATKHYQNSVKDWNEEHNSNENNQSNNGQQSEEHNSNENNQSNNGQQSEEQEDKNCTGFPQGVQDALNAPISTISEKLANTLSYMGNEERLAYDVYNTMYAKWGIKQFTNIANKSEIKHISAVQELVKKYKLNGNLNFTNIDLPELGYKDTEITDMEAGKYDIKAIQDLYDGLVADGSVSESEALKVGCTVEVVDVTDLDKYIKIAEEENADDILPVFNYLRDGSYNHYWAFDKGLKNSGLEKGCCTWENLCHDEYPQKDKGSETNNESQGEENGQGNRNGNGQGRGEGKNN